MINKTVKTITADIGGFQRVTRNYEGVENEETIVVVNNNDSTIEVQFKSQQYATHYEFPNVGKPGIIYIDVTANKTYRWDEEQLKYYCVGSDYQDIKIIYGGNANNE
jgi:hypothetical protein